MEILLQQNSTTSEWAAQCVLGPCIGRYTVTVESGNLTELVAETAAAWLDGAFYFTSVDGHCLNTRSGRSYEPRRSPRWYSSATPYSRGRRRRLAPSTTGSAGMPRPTTTRTRPCRCCCTAWSERLPPPPPDGPGGRRGRRGEQAEAPQRQVPAVAVTTKPVSTQAIVTELQKALNRD